MIKSSQFLAISLNFFAVCLLVSLIAAPLYFASQFTKVAGVKTKAAYLVTSQIDKFPKMSLTQDGANFQISFTKQASSQAYLDVLVITNPTNETQTYSLLQTSGASSVFFGENLENIQTVVKVPPSTSVPISLISTSSQNSQTLQFTIQTN